VVAGLVSLQAKRVVAPEAKEALKALRSRVAGMSLIHEKLYGRVSTDSIDLGEYLQELVRLLVPLEAVEDGTVSLSVTIQPLNLSASFCRDLGLLVTELVSNAMKHALLPKGGGSLAFRLSKEGKTLLLLVEDDGPGFGLDFHPEKGRSLGFKIIDSLLEQNNGNRTILPGPGGRVLIRLEGPF
jgi:two-component sensor histidine kinase